MGIFDNLFKKSTNSGLPTPYTSQIKYEGIAVEIGYRIEESKNHLSEDYAVLERDGIENLIRNRFIPWFKTEEFIDRDDDLIYEGLKINRIEYCYSMISSRYSPTKKEEKIGQFEFFFESCNEYTSDMMESVAMQVYVLNNQIVKVDGYEV